MIGAGQSRPRTLSVTGGSFWKQSVMVSDALIDPGGGLRTTCHALPSRWLVEGIAFYAGFALRWLRDLHADGDELAGTANAYQRLEELGAQVPPGAHGVRATTSPSDAWSWNPLPATFLDPGRGSANGPGVGTRAIEEAAAFTTRAYVQAIEDLLDTRFSRATFTGGAARGTLWPRILADVLGVDVHIAPTGESAARGAALLAGVGAGAYESLADVPPPLGEEERVVSADPAMHRIYDDLFARWMAGRGPVGTPGRGP
jgi:autoinducer 2 (AI-2) kinase